MTKKRTIHDLAEMAGVCIGTVSRVINNKDKVHPETRRRILDLIEQTGYRPSALGRGLVLRRTGNLMLQVPNLADPYSAGVAKIVGGRCLASGYRMLLGDSDYDPAIEAEYLRRARDGSIDGLIVSPLPGVANLAHFRDLVHHGFPLVTMDNAIPTLAVNCVKYDDLAGAAMAMDYLFQKGHRHIAFLQCQAEFQTVRDRRQSYESSYARRGLAINPDLIVTAPKSLRNQSVELFDRLLRLPAPPTAIFAENEIMATVCINALQRLGKRIPEDVAVLAFGDALLDSYTPVPLTTVSLHLNRTGQKAVELLLELIENPQRRGDSPRQYVEKPELVIRRSA